jgi:hypothetical protein
MTCVIIISGITALTGATCHIGMNGNRLLSDKTVVSNLRDHDRREKSKTQYRQFSFISTFQDSSV